MALPDILKNSKPVSDVPGLADVGPNISITYKGDWKDALQLGAGAGNALGNMFDVSVSQSSCGKGGSETKTDLDKVNDSYLKKKGIDAYELEKDIYGKKAKVAEYDIYVDKKTGQLYTQRKPQYNKAGEAAIPTGEYIKYRRVANMKRTNIMIEFCLLGDGFNPEELTQEFSLKPTEYYKKGSKSIRNRVKC